MPKNAILKAHRPSTDLLDAVMGVAKSIERAQDEAARNGLPNVVFVQPRRMLLMAEMHGIEHSVAAALQEKEVNVDLSALAGMRYGMKLADGLKIVDDYTTFDDDRPRLSESDDPDEIKESIVAVLEDELRRTAGRVSAVLEGYGIRVQPMETQIDVVNQILVLVAKSDRPYNQVNGIMSNMKVRKTIRGHVRIRVNISKEAMRLVDDGRELEHVYREFVYENDMLMSSEPSHWSKGMNYNTGDLVSVPGMSGGYYQAMASGVSTEKTMNEFWKRTKFSMVGTATGRFSGRIAAA